MDLAELLTPSLEAMLKDIKPPSAYPGPDELDTILDAWRSQGAAVQLLGHSRQGSPIQAAVIGTGPKTFLGWGYPHPEEPIGAQGLVELGTAALQGKLSDLSDWRLVLVLCADPDNARRQLWLRGDRTLMDFAAGSWRPTHLGLEVDYGFPIDHGPFYQPVDFAGRCRSLDDCPFDCASLAECRRAKLPFPPLPESIALQAAMKLFRPQLVAAMHSTHTSGDYTFLLRREKDEVLKDLTELPKAVGSMRHLGEPVDRGVRWKREAPDLIRERTYDYHRRRLERHQNYRADYAYAGNASAAVIVETMLPGSQFVCPETGLFRHPDFADTDLCQTKLSFRIAAEDRRRGRYLMTRYKRGDEWVVASQSRLEDGKRIKSRETQAAVTRAALGVDALLTRRASLAQADLIWERVKTLPDLTWHPYLEERRRTSVPGAYVGDQAMLIFRAREDYARVATISQAATFNWLWPIHTISLLANFRNFLVAQDQERPEIGAAVKQLTDIQAEQAKLLPVELQTEAPREIAIRSQLARVFRLMLAQAERR